MSFRTTGLDPAPFRHLYGMSDAALAQHGAKRHVADSGPGFPDRVEVRDAEIGERLILLNYTHQPADTPYRGSHAIFVLEGAERVYDATDTIPDPLRRRMVSLRAFDADHDMVDAALLDGRELEAAIGRVFAEPRVRYIQAHYALRGCYAARIERG